MTHARPTQIILQIDNCAREGKNWEVFIFAAHLVYWGWCKEVIVASLIQVIVVW